MIQIDPDMEFGFGNHSTFYLILIIAGTLCGIFAFQPVNNVAKRYTQTMRGITEGKIVDQIFPRYQIDRNKNEENISPPIPQTSPNYVPTIDEVSWGKKFRIYKYHPLDDIYHWLLTLKQNYSRYMSVSNLGYSVERRPILLVEVWLTGRDTFSDKPLPIIWIQAGTHAREWISISTALCLVTRLLNVATLHDTTSPLWYLMSKFRFFIIPILNPDGYTYSWRSNRLWRKNRSTSNLYCDGVDLNRNWGYRWDHKDNYVLIKDQLSEYDAEDDLAPLPGNDLQLKCSNDFSGPYPFSEPETRAIASYAMMWQPYIKAVIELHNPGQLIMYPWAWTKTPPTHSRDLKSAAKEMSEAIYNSTGARYRYGQTSRLLYKAPGCSIDWFYGTLGIKYSFGIELRDTGQQGFTIHSSTTKPTCKEMFRAITALARVIAEEDKF